MKKILGLITVLFLLSVPAFAADNLGDIHKRAVKAYNLKHYAKAAELFTVYVKYHPEAEAYYRIGYSLYKLGKDEEANKYFEYAYAIDPNYTPGPYEKKERSPATPVSPAPAAPVKAAAPAPAAAKTAVPAAPVKAAAPAPAVTKTAVPAAPVKAATPTPAPAAAKTAVPAAPVKAATPTPAPAVTKTAVPAAPVKAAAPAPAVTKTAAPAAPVKAAAPANATAPVNAPAATPQLAPKKPVAPAPKPPVTVPEDSGVMASLGTNMLLVILGAVAVVYLILSYLLFRLARKLKISSPWMTFIPIIQLVVILMGYRAYKKTSSSEMRPLDDLNSGNDSSGMSGLDDFKFTDEPPASVNEPSDFNTNPDFDLPSPHEPESDDFSFPDDKESSSSGDFDTSKPQSDEFSFNDDSSHSSKDEFESTQSMSGNDFNFNLTDNSTASTDDFSFTTTDNSEGFPTDFTLPESEDDNKK